MQSPPLFLVLLRSALSAAVLAGCGERPAARLPVAEPAEFERDILASERAALAAQAEVEAALLCGVAAGDAGLAATALAPGFAARFPAPEDGERVPDARLSIRVYSANAAAETLDARAFVERLLAHAAGWRVARRGFELDRFKLATRPEAARRAAGRAELYLAGELADGSRADLRASCAVELVHSDRWRLAALELLEATRIEAPAPPFFDASAATGFDDRVSAENRAMIQAFIDAHFTLALGGLAAVDWNRDGFWDVIATRKDQLSTLFLNDGRGGFVPAALPFRSPVECPAFLLYVDLDGDGLEELVGSGVLRHAGEKAYLGLWTRSPGPGSPGGRGGPRDPGAWRLAADALEITLPRGLRRISVTTIVPCDVDGDGRLDLFAAVYGNEHSRGERFNTVEAHDGGDNYLFLAEGGLRFREVSEERGIHGTQFTYVATAFDFDADGDVDLWEGNDFGPNRLWLNDGQGSFTEDVESVFAGDSDYSMGVTLADYDNTGEWSLYVSNMSAEAGGRIGPLPRELDDRMRKRLELIASGNRMFTQDPASSRWRERTDATRANEAEWAWGCVFCDLDGDADKDLFVTNGFTSHSDPSLGDWDTYYWHQVAADGGALMRGERTRDVNADEPFEGSFSGYQRDRFYYNPDGTGERMFDTAWHFGLDSEHDGRAVIPIDVDGDGDLDLALWTLQGLRLFVNDGPPRRFARVRVTATRSDAQALGALVTLEAGGVVQRDFVKLVDGFQTQVPRDLHFGLAGAGRIERLRVAWPSGATEEWTDLPVDARIHVVEGEARASAESLPSWPAASRPPRGLPARIGDYAEIESTEDVGGVAPVVLWPAREPGTATPPPELARRFPEVRWLAAPRAGAPRGTFVFDAGGSLARAFLGPERAPEAESELGVGPLTELEAALAAVLDALRDEPAFPDVLDQTARRALDQGQVRRALGLFERAIEGDPTLARALEGMGRANVALGRLENARRCYERAVEVDPDYALGHYNLGVTLLHLALPAEALEPLRAALDLAPEDPRFWLSLGEAAALARQPELALEAFASAARLAPDAAGAADAHALRGKVLGQLGRYVEAREALERALELEPEHAEARAALRLVERLLGESR